MLLYLIKSLADLVGLLNCRKVHQDYIKHKKTGQNGRFFVEAAKATRLEQP